MSNTSIARASVGRSIPSAPLRILDAPDLVDDYYLNLISWGHNNVRGKGKARSQAKSSLPSAKMYLPNKKG